MVVFLENLTCFLRPLTFITLSPLPLQIADKLDVNDAAKSFAADWAETFKYQATFKYHHLGDGPNAQKMRWAYEASIKYIVVCATHLADKDDNVEFKKGISEFLKTVVIQDLIDALKKVKVNIMAKYIGVSARKRCADFCYPRLGKNNNIMEKLQLTTITNNMKCLVGFFPCPGNRRSIREYAYNSC